MKKKLLSLLMAGAVVAGTTLPAFAATTQTVDGLDSATLDAQVKVTGTVLDENGTAPSGRLQVEVPTALSFTVDNQGRLTAGNFTITNRSQSEIDVKVGSFKETIKNGGITLHNNITNFDTTYDRSNVCLVLRGSGQDVILMDGMQEQQLETIKGGQTATIQVLGAAGTMDASQNPDVDTNGANETFDLVFKISKHN